MIPEKLLMHHVQGNKIIPQFLGPEDFTWLRRLLGEICRYDGRPRRELIERLKEPLPFDVPPRKIGFALTSLLREIDRLHRVSKPATLSGVKPRDLRAHIFKVSHQLRTPQQALELAAREFNISTSDFLETLFRDLPSERILNLSLFEEASLAQDPPSYLKANLLLTKALLGRARSIIIDLRGQSRPVIRQAKLRGLICVVEDHGQSDSCRVRISGPYSLFRHTLVYSRHLGELLPLLTECDHFSLTAECILREKVRVLHLTSGLPIARFASRERDQAQNSEPFDSKVEARFAREFQRATRDWDLIREPAPLRCGSAMIFPDFEIRHRRRQEHRWFLEIIGYWRPEYLRHKLQKLKELEASDRARILLCVNQDHACSPDLNTSFASERIIFFRKKIDVNVLLRAIEESVP